MDVVNECWVSAFKTLLDSIGLSQRVNKLTHSFSHITDLVLTYQKTGFCLTILLSAKLAATPCSNMMDNSYADFTPSQVDYLMDNYCSNTSWELGWLKSYLSDVDVSVPHCE